MQKILFIDRDGTLIVEPETDHQVDSLEKLVFIPGALENLSRIIRATDFSLVMVTNQDGLGTASFPEEKFWPAHNRMLEVFKQGGVTFDDVLIDRSLPHEQAPTRKPRLGLVEKYRGPEFDLASSYVIGDRLTDMELARNLGTRGIWIRTGAVASSRDELHAKGLSGTVVLSAQGWEEVARYLVEGV